MAVENTDYALQSLIQIPGRLLEFSQTLLLFANLAIGLYLTGLIWVVQIVQYPQMRLADGENFLIQHRFHMQRITWVVILPMILELGISVVTLFWYSSFGWISIAVLVLVLMIWLSTFFVQVPLHNRLLNGKSEETISRLVASNWIRTAAWSLKSVLLSVAFLNNLLG